MALTHFFNGKVTLYIFLVFNELEVKHLRHNCEHDLHVLLSKSLSKADTLASVEWRPSVSASLPAVRLAGKRVSRVESIGQELVGPLPLG